MNKDALRNCWQSFKKLNHCSLDRMLCKPELRNAFVETVKQTTDCYDEEAILWGVMSLRKSKSLQTS